MSWAYSVCVLFALLFQQCGMLCHVRFHVTFTPPLFVGSFVPGCHFKNTMVPYRWPPKLHSKNTILPYQLPLKFRLRTWLRLPLIHVHKFITTQLLLFNKYECIYGTTYEYIHTYIQTDTACIQHVNVGITQACPNDKSLPMTSQSHVGERDQLERRI